MGDDATEVQTAELRRSLRSWLDRAAAGEPLDVRRYGDVVARITPPDQEETRMAKSTRVVQAPKPVTPTPMPIKAPKTASKPGSK
ncbi:MAG: type II toxin-antitoxin system Phd/YefM family antitoxin [Acidimicrobiales bacterium]